MTSNVVSRRKVLVGGACALAGVARARALTRANLSNEAIIRKYYKAWEKRDWSPIDTLLTDSFTFTSANNDDHISKSVFKSRCWASQIDFIDRFELERVVTDGDEAFVKYLCRTKNGKSFRNVEYFQLRNAKVAAIECYFGEQSSFPSAVSTGQK